jgi:hypothetical protein
MNIDKSAVLFLIGVILANSTTISHKTGNHTLIIFATEQPLPEALAKLRNLVRDNVYV